MQKRNDIKAIFFLGIFSLLLLHQIVPHLHHQYESEHSHNDVVQSEHHHIIEKEIYTKGVLHLILEAHEHSLVTCEALLVQKNSVKQLNVKKNVKTSNFLNRFSISINNDDEPEKIEVCDPLNNYFKTYLSSLDSRGPPTLG